MIGIIQGRLTKSNNKLQSYPKYPIKEFCIAKKIGYKFIEYFADRKINKRNYIWSESGIHSYIKYSKLNNLLSYSFCDDYYINQSIEKTKTKLYALQILKSLKSLKIKKYIIPLYKKSFFRFRDQKKIIKNLSEIVKAYEKENIMVLIESNMSPKKFYEIKKKVYKKKIFFLYDVGNRSILKRDMQVDLNLFGDNIKHIHLKDKNYKNQNVPIGTGQVNFNFFFSILKKINYKESFAIENHRGDNFYAEAKKNYIFFKKLITKNKLG